MGKKKIIFKTLSLAFLLELLSSSSEGISISSLMLFYIICNVFLYIRYNILYIILYVIKKLDCINFDFSIFMRTNVTGNNVMLNI